MADQVDIVQQEIIAKKEADANLAALTSTSTVADWRLWTRVVAIAIAGVKDLFTRHKTEVTEQLAAQRAHTPSWYVTKAKEFQYGYSLMPETDRYAVIDEEARIVSQAAYMKVPNANILRIKVAKMVGGVLAPLSDAELAALTEYFDRIQDAGVNLEITTGVPDQFQLSLAVRYDPLVLTSTGARIDGTNDTPLQDAVETYLETLPFNGLFVLHRFLFAMEQVEGIIITPVITSQASVALLPPETITVEYTPDAGYMLLDSDYFIANTTYTPHAPI